MSGVPDQPSQPSTWRRLVAMMHPRVVWSMANGQPPVLKQFVQLCLVIVYPGWVLGLAMMLAFNALFYVTVYPMLWVLFWPMRAWMKKNRPEEYAASQRRGPF